MVSSLISEKTISLPFRFDATGNVASENRQDRIWADRVKSALGTIVGERVMRSDFGTDIPLMSFDTVSDISNNIEDKVVTLFDALFPTLVLTTVYAEFDVSINTVNITVEYMLPNQDNVTTQVGLVAINGLQPLYEENK